MKDHLTKSGSIAGEDLEVRLPKDQIKEGELIDACSYLKMIILQK
jgi:hypothetical protein